MYVIESDVRAGVKLTVAKIMSSGGIAKGFYWVGGSGGRIHLEIVWREACKAGYLFPEDERLGGLFACFARVMSICETLLFSFDGVPLDNEDTPRAKGLRNRSRILCSVAGRPTTRSFLRGGLCWGNLRGIRLRSLPCFRGRALSRHIRAFH
jgi:hypothetical protein